MTEALSRARGLSGRLRTAEHILLACDFDGTLAPIQVDPAAVYIRSSQRRVLERLAQHPRVTLAAISGRRVADLEERIDVPGAYYAGNHGGEIRYRRRWLHRPDPAVKKEMRAIVRYLTRVWRDEPGMIFEDKGSVLAIHYRAVPEVRRDAVARAVNASMRQFGKPHGFRLLTGKAVSELRPGTGENKGWALQQIVADHDQSPLVISFGDDRTDEDMFRLRGRNYVGVHVGVHGQTAAPYRTRNPATVWAWLTRLAERLEAC